MKLKFVSNQTHAFLNINKQYWKSIQRFVDAEKRNFKLLFYAFITGIVVGTVGSLFRLALLHIDNFRHALYQQQFQSFIVNDALIIGISVIGVLVALFLVKRYAPETAGSGVQEIEGALDGSREVRWKRIIPVKFFASLFSLGGGLLLGREGPTIQLGAGIGKMMKDVFHQKEGLTNPLISAGAAAGLATAFNAPLSGIVFVIEELHDHFRFSFYSVAAIMIASTTADYIVRMFIGVDPVIRMTIFQHQLPSTIWMFVLLGVLLSGIGYFFNKWLVMSLDFVGKFKSRIFYLYAVIAAITLAVIGILSPSMIGGGYQTIRMVLDQPIPLTFLLILFLGRFLFTLVSYSLGVPGGIFAPLLAIGVVSGMLYGNMMHHLFITQPIAPGIFAVAGIAGIFAATVRAPLTGLVLAMELTANFELILPLLVTSITASVVTAFIGNQPIYTTLLKRTLLK